MIHGENRNAGIFERLEFWFHGGVAKNGNNGVHLAGQQYVVIVGVDLIVSAAINLNNLAARAPQPSELRRLKASRSQKCWVPHNGHTNSLAIEAQVAIRQCGRRHHSGRQAHYNNLFQSVLHEIFLSCLARTTGSAN